MSFLSRWEIILTHKEAARRDPGDVRVKCCWKLPQEIRRDKDSGKNALEISSLVSLSCIRGARFDDCTHLVVSEPARIDCGILINT